MPSAPKLEAGWMSMAAERKYPFCLKMAPPDTRAEIRKAATKVSSGSTTDTASSSTDAGSSASAIR